MALTMDTDMVTQKGRTDVAHIPKQPFWLFIVRFVQVFLALIILALSAWAGGGIGFWYAGFGVAIFAFVWTLLFIKYIQLSTFYLPTAYNKYIHLVLECLTVIFWLAAWAALAAVAAVWSWGGLYGDEISCYEGYICRRGLDLRNLAKRYTESQLDGMINATKAAAGLGAIEWLLFIGTLISYGIYLHRNRVATRDAQLGIGPAGAPQQEIKMQPVVNQYPVQQPDPQLQPQYQQVPAEQFQQQQVYPPQTYAQPQQPYAQQQQPYQAQSMA
jgi:hypothetical protein